MDKWAVIRPIRRGSVDDQTILAPADYGTAWGDLPAATARPRVRLDLRAASHRVRTLGRTHQQGLVHDHRAGHLAPAGVDRCPACRWRRDRRRTHCSGVVRPEELAPGRDHHLGRRRSELRPRRGHHLLPHPATSGPCYATPRSNCRSRGPNPQRCCSPDTSDRPAPPRACWPPWSSSDSAPRRA